MFNFLSAFSSRLARLAELRKLRKSRESRLLFNSFEFHDCYLLFNSATTFLFDALHDRKNRNVIIYL